MEEIGGNIMLLLIINFLLVMSVMGAIISEIHFAYTYKNLRQGVNKKTIFNNHTQSPYYYNLWK